MYIFISVIRSFSNRGSQWLSGPKGYWFESTLVMAGFFYSWCKENNPWLKYLGPLPWRSGHKSLRPLVIRPTPCAAVKMDVNWSFFYSFSNSSLMQILGEGVED